MILFGKLDKPSWYVYFKNAIALILFLLLKLFFGKKIKDSKNLLFINTGQIGDLIISSVIFSNDSNFSPEAQVYFLLNEKYKELLAWYNGRIKLIFWPSLSYKTSVIIRFRLLKLLHSLHLKTCVNLTSGRGPINDELTLLSGAKQTICLNNNSRYLKRVFSNYYSRQYTQIINLDILNEFDKQLSLLEKLTNKPAKQKTTFRVIPEARISLHDTFEMIFKNGSTKVILIFPFSDIEEKNWPEKNYIDLIKLFSANGNISVLINGSQQQRAKSIRLIKQVGERKNIFNLAGQYSLMQSAALLEKCDLFIGNDSGFTHIAKALGKNMIALIGGGSFGLFFPYIKRENEYLLYNNVDCMGCEWRCILRRRTCIEDISAEKVYSLAMSTFS